MSGRNLLAGTFLVAASIGGNMAWLAHGDAQARALIAKSGDTVTVTHTGILFGDRHGCPVTDSGTRYTAFDNEGHQTGGVVCKPLFGKPSFY